MLSPFHLAFPVTDLKATEAFYVNLLSCEIGRRSKTWIDFNLYGHQISAHLREPNKAQTSRSSVDGDQVPVPHFGVVLPPDQWQALADKLESHGVDFVISPKTRFQGTPGEQRTLFVTDPSGNHLEFKSLEDISRLFAE